MPKLIFDEFSAMAISPQWRYQLRKRAAGKCRLCGEPATVVRSPFCDKHHHHAISVQKARIPYKPKIEHIQLAETFDGGPVPTQEELI